MSYLRYLCSSLPPFVCRRDHVLFTLFVFVFTSMLFVAGLMSCLRYLCLLAYSGVQHILCSCFDFLRLLYHMLSVSLDCPCLTAP